MSYEIGKHPARSVGAQYGVSSKGNEQIGIEYEFVDGPNKGKRITFYGTFTPDSEQYTFEAMRNSGFQGDELDNLSSLSRKDAPVVQLVLQTEEYNGKSQVRVRFVNKLGGVAMKNALDDTARKSFSERMKGRLQAFDRSQASGENRRPASSRPPPSSAPAQKPDDDIAF